MTQKLNLAGLLLVAGGLLGCNNAGEGASGPAVCGNAAVETGESCDLGELNSDFMPNACRTSCKAATCGDQVVDKLELCDDGNALDGDGCSASCQPEGSALGCRNFFVSTGKDGSGETDSMYINSIMGQHTDTSEFFGAEGWATQGPLTLCAGPVDGDKTSKLELNRDLMVAISLPQGHCLCRSYQAAGTTGSLYCGAHVDAVDMLMSLDSQGTTDDGMTSTFAAAGTSAAEGDVAIVMSVRQSNVDVDACTVAACVEGLAAKNPPVAQLQYTTGEFVSEIINTRQGSDVRISAQGHSFGACSEFTSASVLGALAGAASQEETNKSAGNIDVAVVERLAEMNAL